MVPKPDPNAAPREDAASHGGDASSSMTLVARAQAGDRDALEQLVARYLPRMRRWARGRLPKGARGLADTSDLVQETVFQTFRQIERFEVRGEGALQAYLRQALMNRVRDYARMAGRRPVTSAFETGAEFPARSPVEEAVGQQVLDRYEDALSRLRETDRELVIARVELGLDIDEIAAAFDKPTPAAARKAVARALLRLAQEMDPAR